MIGVFLLILLLIILTSVGFIIIKMPYLHQIWIDVKYEILSQLSALCAYIEDIQMRSKNFTELYNNKGKIAVITGGTRGIGKEVINMLLQCDITVIMGCRETKVGEKLIDEFKKEGVTKGKLHVYPLDISLLKSVKNFVEMIKIFPKIHILINNAGIMYTPYYTETVDGFESQFATNYLGHFLLTHSLYPLIKDGGKYGENARIINVSSCAHEIGEINFTDINNKEMYSTYIAYSQSKLAQLLFTNHLNRILLKNGINIQTHSVHPGLVNTGLFDGYPMKKYIGWSFPYLLKSPMQGAQSIVYAAISQELEGKGGTYISNCTIKKPKCAMDEKLEEKLFEFSKQLLGIQEFGDM